MTNEQRTYYENALQDIINGYCKIAGTLDCQTISREAKLEVLKELGWAVAEMTAIGNAACEELETEMDFRDMII